jgi:regulator of protease activity HflC (stomatin/prohibitin superfamily)
MRDRLLQGLETLATLLAKLAESLIAALAAITRRLWRFKVPLALVAALGWIAHAVWANPPLETVASGEVGLRSNRFTGRVDSFGEGPVLVLPGVHDLHHYSLRDRVFHSDESNRASGSAPFQTIEGLSVGVDLTVRYALDPSRLAAIASQLPADIDGQVVQPAVQGIAYKIFPRYTVKEIFSTKRAEIQEAIEAELKPRLAADGVLLRGLQMGQVDLPTEYRTGMEAMLTQELESEKMKYTLLLKDQEVKAAGLEADAEKVRREKSAEAAANEQVIAARAQEEAMKHVLPFKAKQIEQRKLEAESDKLARISQAQAEAEARRIEASAEADSRVKLADADAYRLESIGKVTSAQMERDGQLLSKHPLLIQKTMADKLSDKVSVIIAAPPSGGGFIGSNLLGQTAAAGH